MAYLSFSNHLIKQAFSTNTFNTSTPGNLLRALHTLEAYGQKGSEQYKQIVNALVNQMPEWRDFQTYKNFYGEAAPQTIAIRNRMLQNNPIIADLLNDTAPKTNTTPVSPAAATTVTAPKTNTTPVKELPPVPNNPNSTALAETVGSGSTQNTAQQKTNIFSKIEAPTVTANTTSTAALNNKLEEAKKLKNNNNLLKGTRRLIRRSFGKNPLLATLTLGGGSYLLGNLTSGSKPSNSTYVDPNYVYTTPIQ